LCTGKLISKDQSGDECLLERIESITTGGVELPQNILLGKVYQWNNNVQIVKDKLVIEISEN